MIIRFAKEVDKDKIRALWQLCFGDSEVFEAFYFDRIFCPEQTLLILEGSVPVSSMQILPYSIRIKEKTVSAGYVYGAMTHPSRRGKGYMGKLLQASFEEMKKRGMQATFLIPQEKWLFDFYAKYGYKEAFPRARKRMAVNGLEPKSKAMLLPEGLSVEMTYSLLLKDRSQDLVLKSSTQAQLILEEFTLLGGQVFLCAQGMALAYFDGQRVVVKEMLALSDSIKEELLQAVAHHYRQDEVWVFSYSETNDSDYYGMLRPLDDKLTLPSDVYMSMMFD